MPKATSLVYAERSDIGRRRANNQDAKVVLPANPQEYRGRGWLFVVADGMGAHAAGERASAMAVEGMAKLYPRHCAAGNPARALESSIKQVNAAIHRTGEQSADCHGMGTTCSVLVLHPRGALLGHVGDSRIYRIRRKTIEQLSRDHSLVWELETAGGMSREAAADAAPKNIITRSLGPHHDVDVDREGPIPVEADDVFVLCTDGLSGVVGDAEIGVIAAELPPEEAVAALVGLTLVRGAPDNTTAIVVRAGPEEASKTSRGDEPWPLSDEAASTQRQGHLAWGSLTTAAVCLLIALVVNPWSMLTKAACAANEIVRIVCTALSLGGLLLAIGCGLFGIYSVLTSSARGRLLRSGDVLGKGPYRTYDCTPGVGLVEGMVASLEAEAGTLSATDNERTVTILARARQHAAAGAFHEAVTALAEAIAVHTAAIEAARRDQTAVGKPAAEPLRD